MKVPLVSISTLLIAHHLFVGLCAAVEPTPEPQEPKISAASAEGEQAMKGFRVPAGLEVKLFAAEPLVANPVAFCLDERGRVYVCESFRQSKGIEDNRGHDHWLDDDLAAQTVEDRLAYIQKHIKDKGIEYTRQDDRVRLLEDTDGDGVADKASVFANRFNSIVEGTGAGVLARRGNVYFTCIPKLWLLRDEDGNGQAEVRKPLHHGYGVRFAFRGHDLHGLCLGPDGKLYYSVGDRGYNVTAGGKTLADPESGAVFRCNLDGSDLEVFATGLRNPQEVAFDDYGNLFTGDNNSDSGDQARWVYVVEGGDSGWRMAYQYLGDRGPFNREKIWHPHHEGQPAYIVPPIANFASGPSGLAFYPGTGLPEHFKGRFLLCDFRGGPANSGVRSFRVKPKGAGFDLVDAEESIWKVLATDVDFGPDGAIYVSDWVNGWNGEGKGRIYRFADPTKATDPTVLEVQKLLAEDLSKKSSAELVKLLSHADRRVRQEAQFALVDKSACAELIRTASDADSQLARIHAIWGLGQVARQPGETSQGIGGVVPLLKDEDAEIRAQAANVLGEAKYARAAEKLVPLLKDENSRVRYFAALSLGKLKHAAAIDPILEMLAANEDRDPMLRHAGIMALTWAGDAKSLAAAARHHSPSARIGVAVSLRKQKSPQVADFLGDVDPRVSLEAARAIHDVPIPEAMPQLAALAARATQSDPLLRRVLNANFRLGAAENAAAVAGIAARRDTPDAMRIEALRMLAAWDKPSSRDRVLGMWRPLAKREPGVAAAALQYALPGIVSGPPRVAAEGAKIAASLGIQEVGPALVAILEDKSRAGALRADALAALATLRHSKLANLVRAALKDENPEVRAAARNSLAQTDPAVAIELLDAAVQFGEFVERQLALATLANMTQPGTDAIILKALELLAAGEMPAPARLDVLEAANRRASPKIKSQLARYEAARPKDDPLAPFAETLSGGNAERGKQIFFERSQVSCVRCHKVGGVGGDVGPDLTKIAVDMKPDYLLESLVLPSKTIAKNFDTVVLVTSDGLVHTGIVRQEDDEQIRLITAEGKPVSVPKAEIEERKAGKSSMPDDLVGKLTKPELRDLLEYLSSLR